MRPLFVVVIIIVIAMYDARVWNAFFVLLESNLNLFLHINTLRYITIHHILLCSHSIRKNHKSYLRVWMKKKKKKSWPPDGKSHE